MKSRASYLIVALTLVALAIASYLGPRLDAKEPVLMQEVKHSKYPISIRIPRNWKAEEGRDPVRPMDVWTLSPKNVEDNQSTPRFEIGIARQPRGGRQSAFFPGAKSRSARTIDLSIGSTKTEGTLASSNGVQYLAADFERGILALSLQARYRRDEDLQTIQGGLKSLRVGVNGPTP